MQHVNSHDGLDPSTGPNLSDDVVLSLFRSFARIEAFSAAERADAKTDELPIPRGIAHGEEGAIAGALAAMRSEDSIFPSEADTAVALARGARMIELASQSLPWKSIRVAPPGWHNGAQLTHAAGFAWGAKIRRDDVVAIATAAEKALETGEVHNALNFAGVFKLPAIFFVRASHRAAGELRGRALEYGIRVALSDGSDPIATCKVMRDARTRAASGGGATLVGALFNVDEKRDASLLLRRHIENAKIATRAEIEKIFEDAAREAAAAFDSPPALVDRNMFEHVFETAPWHLQSRSPSHESSGK